MWVTPKNDIDTGGEAKYVILPATSLERTAEGHVIGLQEGEPLAPKTHAFYEMRVRNINDDTPKFRDYLKCPMSNDGQDMPPSN